MAYYVEKRTQDETTVECVMLDSQRWIHWREAKQEEMSAVGWTLVFQNAMTFRMTREGQSVSFSLLITPLLQ